MVISDTDVEFAIIHPAASTVPRNAPEVRGDPSTGTEHSPHVIVVDDDGTTRVLAKRILETYGCRVTEACDGAEAIVSLARGEHYDLMLLDLEMPAIGGRDVLRSVRQSMTTVGMPVIMLTGVTDRETEVELMELGADDYLRKPIDPPLLSIRVKAALRRARG